MSGRGLPADGGAGRGSTLAGLVERYRSPLLRYFVRRGLSQEAAEDCAQDVFLRLAKTRPTAVDNQEAYLFRIAASVLIDHGRRARARGDALHDQIDDNALVSGARSPHLLLEDREALQRVAEVVAKLPQRTREMFLLNRLDGLSYTQLAARFSVSVKVVEREMSRALLQLRRGVADVG
jgi:RNA polymerase sigma-70 factor (ECF subfamily)